MNLDVVTMWLHYLGVMAFFAALVSEHLLLRKAMTPPEIRRLARLDSLCGAMFICVVMTGTLKLLVFGKGSEYYLHSWQFHVKMGLVLLVFLVSIYPTMVIVKYRQAIKGMNEGELLNMPVGLQYGIRLELLLVALIPLFAAAMTRMSG